MKIKTTLLAACAAFVLALPAQALINLSVSFSPTLTSGSDPNGFENSTWTLQYNSSQTTYISNGGYAGFITESASLTITGATNTDYNSTFAITETGTTNFVAFPNAGGNAAVGTDTNGSSADFSFGAPAVNVSNLFISGTALASPSIGDPIELSDWQGMNVSAISIWVGPGIFNMPNSTLNAAVPEPSTYAAIAGLAALGFVVLRRHRR